MSLPLLHAGRTNPGLSAALDLRFALDKSLTAYRGPTPSFSRASTGSYFDGSGVLRYAAVNILTYSEDFTNAAWVNQNTTESGNTIVSPDGKTTADSLIESATNSSHLIYQQANATSGSIYTFSVYLKANQRSFAYIQMADSSSPNKRFSALINISNGTIVTTRSLNSPTNTSSSISDAGNGWYRASITMSQSGGSIIYAQVAISDSSTPTYDAADLPTYSGNISNGIFIWGAQLEASSIVGTYCPTTSSANSAPRFNHTFNGTSWVSRGLLVEEQRTNGFLRSNEFSNAATWFTSNNLVSTDSTTSPDGTIAFKVTPTTSSSAEKNIFQITTIANSLNTHSIYVKSGTQNFIQLMFTGGDTNYANFNISSGVTGNKSAGVSSSTISDVGNGWYRISVTLTNSGASGFAIFWINSLTDGRAPSTTSTGNIYLFGAQYEVGAFPTSYIPTTSASTTRSADVCQITGSDFSGFWNGTEGSIAFEADVIGNNSGNGNQFVFGASLSSSAANNQIALIRNLNNLGGDYGLFVNNGGTPQVQTSRAAGSWTVGSTVKAAAAYKLNDFADVLNGGAAITDTSGTIPTVDQLSIGNFFAGGGPLNGHIARLRYFNKRLPNATLQLLSEPDPTLNLQFALNKTLTPVAGPAPSFSRASTGTYFNASGVLTSASINTPRFDHVYSGGQWVSRGLLLEEQRTNGLLQSNGYGNSPWTIASSRGTVTQNAASPDGTNNAWTGNCTVTAPGGFYLIQGGLSSPSATYTLSFFAKKDNNGFVAIEAGETSNDVYVFFDLTNGLSGNLSSVGGYTNISHGLSDCGNGWYRCRLTFTKSNSNNLTAYIYPTCNSFSSLSCTSGQTNFIFGAQYETGSFATSYIGTTTSSATRSADVCQITGTSFGWMWNQGEGSFSFEADALNPNSVASGQTVYSFDDGSSANSIYGLRSGNTAGSDYLVLSYTSGVEKVNFSNPAGTWLVNVPFKNAIGFKLNDFAQSNNGGSVVTDTNCTMPIGVNQLSIGRLSYAGFPINGHIAKLIYYPARLTNTKLRVLSGSSISSFIPSDVAGLELWLDASDLSTLYQSSGGSLATADGDPVGEWRDKSGNLRHATQTDGTKKPALKLAIKNGLSALRMDGSNDSFDLGDNFKHQSITVIAVQKITTTGVCVAFSRGGAGSYNPAVALVYNRSTPNTSATFNPSGGSQVVNVAITQNQFSIFRAMADGSTFTNTTNGTTATTAQTSALQFNTNSVTIGCMETYGLNAAGDYCELIIYSKALSASEWSSVNSYLNAKWSIY